MAKFHSFLWLNSIPLCVCVCMYVCVYATSSLSIDGHLGCFHVFAIVNKTAVNIGVHVSFQINVLFSLDIYLGVELLVAVRV